MAETDFAPGARSALNSPDPDYDWRRIAYLVNVSRALDKLEEERLVPERKISYQFSARGHDMAQIMLGSRLRGKDGTCGYYRSRPLLLALGVPMEDALGSAMGRAGGYSDGATSASSSTFPIRAECPRFPCRAASALNIRRPPAGRRRSNIIAQC
jgi:2-oxoisovalerate dehydrogenase E1 component